MKSGGQDKREPYALAGESSLHVGWRRHGPYGSECLSALGAHRLCS